MWYFLIISYIYIKVKPRLINVNLIAMQIEIIAKLFSPPYYTKIKNENKLSVVVLFAFMHIDIEKTRQ